MLSKLKKIWLNTMVFLTRILLLMTFLGILAFVVYAYYLWLTNFNFVKIATVCLMLYTLIHVNKSIQGGK